MNQYFYIKEHPVINLIIVTIQQQPFQRKHVVQFLHSLRYSGLISNQSSENERLLRFKKHKDLEV